MLSYQKFFFLNQKLSALFTADHCQRSSGDRTEWTGTSTSTTTGSHATGSSILLTRHASDLCSTVDELNTWYYFDLK